MKRRRFITLLGAAAAWSLAAHAQQAQEMRRVGALLVLRENDPEGKVWLRAFEEELQRLGWEQGRNIQIEYRFAGSDEHRLRTWAAELAGMRPDVLFTAGTPALVALSRETRSLPIVFAQVSDPVKLGLVASLARPAGNITGFVTVESAFTGKWLELLRDMAPDRKRVTVLLDPDNPSQLVLYFQGIETAASTLGMQLTRADVRSADDIERAIEAVAQQPNGALVVVPTAVTLLNRDLIIALAARHRLPAIYPYRIFAVSGGLISYGVSLPDSYRRAASYVGRILKGAKPGDLPVQLASKFELVVNLKTAKALGLTIPEPFLQTADEVIE